MKSCSAWVEHISNNITYKMAIVQHWDSYIEIQRNVLLSLQKAYVCDNLMWKFWNKPYIRLK